MHSLLFWCVDILVVLYSTLSLSLVLMALGYCTFDYNILENYSSNWDYGIIKNISSNEFGICDNNDIPLLTNMFPGNIAGCDCFYSKLSGLQGNLFDKRCEDFQLENNCVPISKKNATYLRNWKGVTLCTEQTEYNYWNYTNNYMRSTDIENQKCLDGYKQCGILDTFGNILCEKQDTPCPINKIIFANSNYNTSLYYPDKTFSQIPLTQYNTIVYFSNEFTDEPVLSQMQITPTGVCSLPLEGNIGENYYKLNKNIGSPECIHEIKNSTFDSRLSIKDRYSMYDFYSDNNILHIVNNLPMYPKNYTILPVIMQSVNYYGWNITCLQNDTYSDSNLIYIEHKISKAEAQIYILALASVFHFCISLLFIVVYKIWYSNFEPSPKIMFGYDCINMGMIIVIIVFCFITKHTMENLVSPYYNFVNSNCIDAYTKSIFDIAYGPLFNVKSYILPNIISSIIIISIIIINYFVYFIVTKKPFKHHLKYL